MRKFSFKPVLEKEIVVHPNLNKVVKPLVFVSEDLYPGAKIWGHIYTIPKLDREELKKIDSVPHTHEVDEIHVTYSREGAARYEKTIDGKTYLVESPSTSYVPAGVEHHIRWLEVKEPVTVIAIVLKGKYSPR